MLTGTFTNSEKKLLVNNSQTILIAKFLSINVIWQYTYHSAHLFTQVVNYSLVKKSYKNSSYKSAAVYCTNNQVQKVDNSQPVLPHHKRTMLKLHCNLKKS